MTDNDIPHPPDPVQAALLLLAESDEIRAKSDEIRAKALRALAAYWQTAPAADDPLLDRRQRRQAYPGLGSVIEAAIASGELPATRGSRQRALVRRSAIEAWLAARPVTPRPPKSAPAEPIDSIDAWDRAVGLGGRR